MHPKAIAEEVGLVVDQVRAALRMLEAPDLESRSPEEEGRRIVRMDEHRDWGWRIVNYAKYRSIRDEDERREQNRLSQKKWRDKQASASVITHKPRKPISAHTEADTEADTHTDAIASAAAKPPRATRKCPPGFEPAEPESWIAANMPGVNWQLETEAFRDHTFKNAISDWHGCWRNWMRRAKPAARAFLTAKERDTANAAEWVRKSTGGLLERAFPAENIIEMEPANAAQIRNG